MSMDLAQSLLMQYNKDAFKDQQLIDTKSDAVDKFATESYTNPYDKFATELSDNQNYNVSMWHQAFKLGEQDTLISLLQANANRTLSDEFYDPNYYDYESMMLELQLPYLDNEKTEERFESVYNPESATWEEQSLGQMTDQAYVSYVLNKERENKTAEIVKAVEQDRKDNMKWYTKVGNTLLATLYEFGEGLIGALAGMADIVGAVGYTAYQTVRGENVLDSWVNYFADESLTAMEKESLRKQLDEYERLNTYMRDIDGNITGWGTYLGGIANSIGMMAPTIALNMVTGGLGTVGSMASFYSSVYAGNLYEVGTNPNTADSPSWLKITNATIKAGAEAIIEVALERFIGSSIPNKLMGISGKRVTAASVAKTMTKGAGWKYLLKSAGQEGLEEFLQDFSTNLVDQFSGLIYEGYEKTGVTFQTLIDSFLVGAAASIVMSGGRVASRYIKSKATKGRSDIYIETNKGEYKRVKGLQGLAYTDIINEIKQGLDKLKKEKFATNKNLKLAQELYTSVELITQFYSSFDATRVKNAEMLLDRVAKAEQTRVAEFRDANQRAGQILSDASIAGIVRGATVATERAGLRSFATRLNNALDGMMLTASVKSRTTAKATTEKVADKLEANGVQNIQAVVDKDGNISQSEVTTDTSKFENLLNKHPDLNKDYEYLFLTDGHVAIEQDGFLYVSEAWLENYETSDIYKFLMQSKVIDTLLSEKELNAIIDEAAKFSAQFTGNENVSRERALMDLLFNKSVFQAFLLSNNGHNAHAYSKQVFRLLTLVHTIATDTKLSKAKRNYLKQIEQQIRDTMREPTLKAILNWNMDPQSIGADYILSKADREFIRRYQASRNIERAVGSGAKLTSAYRHTIDDLVANSDFNAVERSIVEKALSGKATEEENLMAAVLLNIADQVTDANNVYYYTLTKHTRDVLAAFNEVIALKDYSFSSLESTKVKTGELLKTINTLFGDAPANISPKVQTVFNFVQGAMSLKTSGEIISAVEGLYPLLSNVLNELLSAAPNVSKPTGDLSLFLVPVDAMVDNFALGIDKNQIAADVLNAFKDEFGTDAILVYRGQLDQMSYSQREKLMAEMAMYGLKPYDYAKFVIRRLESALGNDFIVAPDFSVLSNPNISETEAIENLGFQIITAIQPEEILFANFTGKDVKARNEAFLNMFNGVGSERTVGDFIMPYVVSKKVYDRIKDVPVKLSNIESYGSTYGFENESDITIKPNQVDIVQTFMHELNHLMQNKFKMQRGSYDERYRHMPALSRYILRKYYPLVCYLLRQRNHADIATNVYINHDLYTNTIDDYRSLPATIKKATEYIVYSLVQGELWADLYNNSVKARGITYKQIDGQTQVHVSPNGNAEFDLPQDRNAPPISKGSIYTNDTVANENTFAQVFDDILHQRDERSAAYHAKLTKESSAEVLADILNPSLSAYERATATIDDIIKDPEHYLSNEILATMPERSEAAIYGLLRDYFEKQGKGISIDRDAVTHEYLLVDDNAFNDLYSNNTKNADNDSTSLVTNSTLGQRYDRKVLEDMGIPSDIAIIADPTAHTQTVFDKEHPNGAIYIKTHDGMTNAEFLDRLNHEFRHIMQYYNGLESGFTPDFAVSKEMIADVKKHVPEIYKNETLRNIAKALKVDPDTYITQQFIYRLVGAELNAYGIRASLVNMKPIFVEQEAGKPTIFMPWYDKTTGEGRYETEFLANRADDIVDSSINNGKGLAFKTQKKTHKYVEKTKDAKPKYSYKGDSRYFTKEQAKGTNLEYFYRKNRHNQMDPDLQKFVIATTGNLDKLSKEVVHAIKTGRLTKQNLMEWFRETDASNVNQFTFDLLNKSFFKNDTIRNIQQLDQLVYSDVSFWWAALVTLAQEGLPLELLVKKNNVDEFLNFVNSLEGTEWAKKIEKRQEKFNYYYVIGKDGKSTRTEIPLDESTSKWLRVFAMQHFDGTLANAFLTANTLRSVVQKYQNRDKDISLEQTTGKDNDLALGDMISDANLSRNDKAGIKNITEAYKLDTMGKSTDQMIEELTRAYYERHLAMYKEKIDSTHPEYSAQKRKAIAEASARQNTLLYNEKLQEKSSEDIATRYNNLVTGELMGIQMPIGDGSKDLGDRSRVRIQANITRYVNRIKKYLAEGKVYFKNLPPDVRDMFTQTTATDSNGKKYTVYAFKDELYKVGRHGQKAADTSKIAALEKRLKEVADLAKNEAYLREADAKAVERARQKLDKDTRKAITKAMQTTKSKSESDNVKTTEFTVKKKQRTSDTPNNFTIVSNIEMPSIVQEIFDTSINDMADTRVQFASKDEDGKLYDKDSKKFKSRLEHEVANWDAFYEANRQTLLNLTRAQVLDIVEFIQKGMTTIDGPSNKLTAFQIFLLGYIVQGARKNMNHWNFSDAEIDMIEKLYEKKASDAGSALNAVSQMIKVIDPIKKIRQRMLDEYNITEDEVDDFYAKIDAMQTEKNLSERKKKAEAVIKAVEDMEALMVERDTRKKGFGKRWYDKLKSARYTFMLSSPMTWIRNQISNVVAMSLNKTADALGGFLTASNKYRAEQWDLSKTKISPEVRTFIEENIKNSPLFNALYEGGSKYDFRDGKLAKERTLFVSMIVSSLEKKYAADHRFDSETANIVASFVNRMISDKTFVKLAATRYLGKILTIENNKGNVDLSQGLSDDVLNLFAESVILANSEYMRKRSFLADMIDGLRENHKVAYEVLTWWQPFLNSSFNWFQEMLKFTPLGIVTSVRNLYKLEERINKLDNLRAQGQLVTDSRAAQYLAKRDVGKGVIGLVLTGLGILLALTGVIKIDDDDNKFYMTAGDIKVDISNIFATSSLLVGASLAQIGKQSFNDIMNEIADAFTEGFVMKDIFERHKWDAGMWEGLLTESESVLRSFVPQFVQLFVRALNNQEIKYSAGFKGMWERCLNTFVPTQPFGTRKVDPYTGEIQTKYALPFIGELLKGGLLGPRIFWEFQSEQEKWAREHGVNKGQLTGKLTVNGTEYQLGDTVALNIKYGELNEKSLASLEKQSHYVEQADGSFATLPWNKLTDKQKANVISRTMEQNAQITKIWYWTQTLGKKYYASDTMYQLLRRAGITKNIWRGDKGFSE